VNSRIAPVRRREARPRVWAMQKSDRCGVPAAVRVPSENSESAIADRRAPHELPIVCPTGAHTDGIRAAPARPIECEWAHTLLVETRDPFDPWMLGAVVQRSRARQQKRGESPASFLDPADPDGSAERRHNEALPDERPIFGLPPVRKAVGGKDGEPDRDEPSGARMGYRPFSFGGGKCHR
jgi:hypothetical protein